LRNTVPPITCAFSASSNCLFDFDPAMAWQKPRPPPASKTGGRINGLTNGSAYGRYCDGGVALPSRLERPVVLGCSIGWTRPAVIFANLALRHGGVFQSRESALQSATPRRGPAPTNPETAAIHFGRVCAPHVPWPKGAAGSVVLAESPRRPLAQAPTIWENLLWHYNAWRAVDLSGDIHYYLFATVDFV